MVSRVGAVVVGLPGLGPLAPGGGCRPIALVCGTRENFDETYGEWWCLWEGRCWERRWEWGIAFGGSGSVHPKRHREEEPFRLEIG